MPGRYEAYNPLPAAMGGLQLGAGIGSLLRKRDQDNQLRELYSSGVDLYSPEAQAQIGTISPDLAQEYAKTGAEIGLQGAQTGKIQQDRRMAILGKTVPWAMKMGEGKPTAVKRQVLKQIMPHILDSFGGQISPEQANIDQFDDATIENTVWPNAQRIAQSLSGAKFTSPVKVMGPDGKLQWAQADQSGNWTSGGPEAPPEYSFNQDPYGYTQALNKHTGTAAIAGGAGQRPAMPQPGGAPAAMAPQNGAQPGRLYPQGQQPEYQGELNSLIDQLRRLPANHPDRAALQQIVNDRLRQNMQRHRQDAAGASTAIRQPMAQGLPPEIAALPPEIGAARMKAGAEAEIKDRFDAASQERKLLNDLTLEGARTENDKALAETRSNLEIGKKSKEQDISNSKNAMAALPLLDEAEKLIPKSTGSYIGNVTDRAAGVVGIATEGSKNISKLQIIGNKLIAMVPRFEGPQSNYDVQLYREAAGDLANPEKPVENRMEALKTMRQLLQKYSTQGQQGQQGSSMSPDDIKAAYKAGQITREQATQMLRENHGFK